ENTPDIVKRFIGLYVEMQFNDVRSMMMIRGCNYAATTVLVNLISGMSTIFYNQRGKSGDLFKGCLTEFYPWELQPLNNAPRESVIACLYDTIRNPLAHSLGVVTKRVSAKGQPGEVIVTKPSGKSFGYSKQW